MDSHAESSQAEQLKTAELPDEFRPGQRWLEIESGRPITILQPMVRGTGPSWHYDDDQVWHYCQLFDFTLWGRFKYLGEKTDG